MKFRRETATDEADLPHEFQPREEKVQPVCKLCLATAGEPRHLAWERQSIADRERAAVGFDREVGS